MQELDGWVGSVGEAFQAADSVLSLALPGLDLATYTALIAAGVRGPGPKIEASGPSGEIKVLQVSVTRDKAEVDLVEVTLAEMKAHQLDAGSEGGVKYGRLGLHGEADASVGVDGKVTGTLTPTQVQLGYETTVGLQESASGVAALGIVHAKGGVDALLGANSKTSVGLGLKDAGAETEHFAGLRAGVSGGADIAGLGVGARAEAWAGAGVSGEAHYQFKDGKIGVKIGLGVGLGVGAKLQTNLTIDVGEVGRTAKAAADTFTGVADAMEHGIEDVGGKAAGAATGAAKGIAHGIGKLF